jgi:agmatinase
MPDETTFAGLPYSNDVRNSEACAVILGAPHGTPYKIGITSHSAGAPAAIREASQKYGRMIDHYDFDLGGPVLGDCRRKVVDGGDAPGGAANPEENRRNITLAVRDMLEAGAVPILLGGDDSVPIPFLAAFEEMGPLTIVQIDAHIDWRQERFGEPRGYSSAMRRASEMPWIAGIVQVGMRGVGTARVEEIEAARAYGARFVTAREIHRRGVEAALDLVPAGRPCLVTFDCDALDPSIMPAVAAPLPGGLTYFQAIDLIHGVAQKSGLAGFDLVEYVPGKDPDGLSALTAARIVLNVIGALVRQRSCRGE